MTIMAFLAALAGFVAFGLASDRHHEKHLGRRCPAPVARRLRWMAWGWLALALAASFAAWGAVIGALGWLAAVMTAAAATFLALNLLPGRSSAPK